MELRDYQQKAIDAIRDEFRKGHRKVLLHMATGAGKTVCFSHMMIESMNKGIRSMMVVRGRKLVDQASRRLFRESVNHGVIMSNHWNSRPAAPIQICSVDTVHSKAKKGDIYAISFERIKLIIIDEVHMATSEAFKKLIEKYPDAFVVGVTASPYTNDSLRHVADTIVHPITMRELIDLGFLVPPRYFTSGKPIDLSGVKTSGGDYVQSQLAIAMDKSTITGDIVSHWQRLAENRPTLCFAVNVAHSCHIVAQFNAAGIPAEHCDADTPDVEREKVIERLQRGETRVVSNVGIFCTGVDIPAVSCLILARPTKSYNLYVQQVGRGTRVAPGKSDFLVLDHAGNVLRHKCVLDEPEANLDGKKVTPKSDIFTCKSCYAIFPRKGAEKCAACETEVCPECDAALVATTADKCKACGKETCKTCHSICVDCKPKAERGGPVFVDGSLAEWKPAMETDETLAESFCENRLVRYNNATISAWKAYYDTEGRFGKDIARKVFFRVCKRLNIEPPKARRGNSNSSVQN